MTLFIVNDTGGAGSGNVSPDAVHLDLFSISNSDLGDGTHVGYGEGATTGDLIQVTYDRSKTGPCPQRLDTVVNTNFGVNPQNIDILIIGAGANFTLSDGTSVLANGLTIPVGNAENPTTSVLIIYDTTDNNGAGICVRREGSPNYDLPEPSSVILYHEMSHAFHLANGDPLATGDNGCTASPEENRAETDENDMRDQLGLAHRDATDHCGNAGCTSPGCCIVATVTTGSPYSEEVNALRQVRDGLLRCSEIGYDFFAYLHKDYYAFSPEVCRLMAFSEELRNQVRARFVQPLTLSLDMVRVHTVERANAAELGARFLAAVAVRPEVAALTANELAQGHAVLARGLATDVGTPALKALAALLDERAQPSAYVRWALIRPIEILIEALCWRLQERPAEEIGLDLGALFDDWAVEMPLTDVWVKLSRWAVTQELEFLEKSLLRDAGTRLRFGRRLVAFLQNDEQKASLVEARWCRTEETVS
jgi:hypothetical protein